MKIRSLGDGWCLRLYEDKGYSGRYLTLSGSLADFRPAGLNDKFSSVKAVEC